MYVYTSALIISILSVFGGCQTAPHHSVMELARPTTALRKPMHHAKFIRKFSHIYCYGNLFCCNFKIRKPVSTMNIHEESTAIRMATCVASLNRDKMWTMLYRNVGVYIAIGSGRNCNTFYGTLHWYAVVSCWQRIRVCC